MVSQSYLRRAPQPPGPAKLFLDQSVIPVMIDTAATVEQAIDQLGILVRRSPGPALIVACMLGAALGRALLPRR